MVGVVVGAGGEVVWSGFMVSVLGVVMVDRLTLVDFLIPPKPMSSPFEIIFWGDQPSFRLTTTHRLEPDDSTLAFAFSILWNEEIVPVFVGVFISTDPALAKFDLVVMDRVWAKKLGRDSDVVYETKNYALVASGSFSAAAARHTPTSPTSPCFLEEPEPWLDKLVGGSEPPHLCFAVAVDGVGHERVKAASFGV